MIKRILLDLDDVLNKFTPYALRHVGCPINSYEQFPAHVGFDMVAAANVLLPGRNFIYDTFWKLITRDVWASVPVSDEAELILNMAESMVGRSNVCILTSPTKDPECLAGKLEWIQAHMPSWLHRQYLIGPCKQFCAAPDALLIDDAVHNVVAFESMGGKAMLIPRPWNS